MGGPEDTAVPGGETEPDAPRWRPGRWLAIAGLPALAFFLFSAMLDVAAAGRTHDESIRRTYTYRSAAIPLLLLALSASVLPYVAVRARRRINRWERWPLVVSLVLVAGFCWLLAVVCGVAAFTSADSAHQVEIVVYGPAGDLLVFGAVCLALAEGTRVVWRSRRPAATAPRRRVAVVAGLLAAVALVGGTVALRAAGDGGFASEDSAAPGHCGSMPQLLPLPPDPGVGSRVVVPVDGLTLARPDGGDRRQLWDGPTATGASWSRDGRRAVIRRDGVTVIDVAADGSTTDRSLGIEQADTVALEPSGDRIAYIRRGHAHVRPLEQPDQDVDLGPAARGELGWSFDGSRLVVRVGLNNVVVDVDTGDRRTLPAAASAIDASGATWSPTADRLVYRTVDQLVLADGDGAGRRLLLKADDTGFMQDVAWSPDGSLVSLIWTSLGDPLGFRSSICVVPVDAGEPQLLDIARDVTSSPPRWSPDGRYLLAQLDPLRETLDSTLVAIDVRTGQARVLPGASGDWVPAPDDGPICDALSTWIDGGPLYLDDSSPYEATVASVLARARRLDRADEVGELLAGIAPQLRDLRAAGVDVDAGERASIEAAVGLATTTCGLQVERLPGDVAPTNPNDDPRRWALRYTEAIFDVTAPIARDFVPAITGDNFLPPDGDGPDWDGVRAACFGSSEALPDLDALLEDAPPEAAALSDLLQQLSAGYHDFVDTCLTASATEDVELLRSLRDVGREISALAEQVGSRTSELVG